MRALQRDGLAGLGRPVERIDRAGLAARVRASEQRLPLAGHCGREILELEGVGVGDGTSISTSPSLRRTTIPGSSTRHGVASTRVPFFPNDLEPLPILRDERGVDLRDHVAGEAQRPVEGHVDA